MLICSGACVDELVSDGSVWSMVSGVVWVAWLDMFVVVVVFELAFPVGWVLLLEDDCVVGVVLAVLTDVMVLVR